MVKLKTASIVMVTFFLGACSSVGLKDAADIKTHKVSVTQIRNATVKVSMAGKTILIDPMLAKKGAYPGFAGTVNSHLRNPLVDLPFSVSKVLESDVIILTHLHEDHWDKEAQKMVPKEKPIFVQNAEDQKVLKAQGFYNVQVLTENTRFGDISLVRTDGQHGSDQLVKKLPQIGLVSGVLISHPGSKSIYVAGDTVWNDKVKEVLDKHKPEVVILNAGAAQIVGLGNIIMNENDVEKVVTHAPYAKVIATHMEAINHCVLKRADLRDYLSGKNLIRNVEIPEDGETLYF